MENALKVIKEFQNLMNSFEWFEKVKKFSNLLFFGGLALVILNRFLFPTSIVYAIGFYGFLAGALVKLAKEEYKELSIGL